jgi:hypothetical protein
VRNVFNQRRKAFEVGVTPTDVPTMPIEVSMACFRPEPKELEAMRFAVSLGVVLEAAEVRVGWPGRPSAAPTAAS